MADVVLRGVTKVFPDGTTALDGVDLNVADGEFVVLVGPSGCGKSTLLRIVAGLDDVTAGTVEIGGRVVNDLAPKSRDIAMVFQNYALYPHMSVEDNLGFSLKVHRVAKDEARANVHEVAHVLALEPLLGRKPKALSGGQRQRVAMGRAMVRHPQVFLMDEPLSNLDAKLRVAMRGELTRLHQQYGTTTLYVTHDQVEAMTLGDRIAVLHAGRLQQVGTPDELYRTPCNVFVAGFIGSPAMNLASGVLTAASDGRLTVELGESRFPLPSRPELSGSAGRAVVVGLRPQAITVDPDPGAEAARITVAALAVEHLGHEKNILFLPPFDVPDSGAGKAEADMPTLWTANVDADVDIAIGDQVTLCLDLAQAYFFDAATGLAITRSGNAVITPRP